MTFLSTCLCVSLCLQSFAAPESDEDRALRLLRSVKADIIEIDNDADGHGLTVDFQNSTDDGALRPLRGLKRLVGLRILGGGFTDAGLQYVDQVPNLKTLVINSKTVTDQGLAYVGKLKSLEKLDIMNAHLSAKGLSCLTGLPRLKRLYLYATKIGDADLLPLEKMSQLTLLDLPSTVSVEGVEKLRRMLPKVKIERLSSDSDQGRVPDKVERTSIGAEARIAWLKSHTAALRSIDPADEDFADLEPIRQAIGDARIVMLSEQTHGVGATFHARTRLIKFLHQRCGFDVLAFESGLYDCKKAWELLREGRMPARQAISQGIFNIWAGSAQVQPLIDYVGQQARGPRPLEICGFDCQFSAAASAKFLPRELEAALDTLPFDKLTYSQRAAVIQGCRRLALSANLEKNEEEAFAACRKALASADASAGLSSRELAFWRQFIESTTRLAEATPALSTRPANIERSYSNLRDRQMARNFIWLAQSFYPTRKIMVWAHAFHLMRNQSQVYYVDEPDKTTGKSKTYPSYAQVATMGNEVWKALGKDIYSIYFTAGEGVHQALPDLKPTRIKPAVPGSLEDLLLKAGCENAFLDLKKLDTAGTWLKERLIARVLGNSDYEADWTQVCDGIVFTRKMYPSTAVPAEEAEYQPHRDPTPLGTNFDRYTTRDAFNRTISFYLSHPPKDGKDKLPLAVFVQGSGCGSVFHARDGKIYGGYQNLLLAAAKARLRVLVVEKPGVDFGASPGRPGSAEQASARFRGEHTLPRWVEAVNAAVQAAQRLPDVDWTRTLLVGHSEGGIVAAHVAAANPRITHVAILAGGGPSQLHDLLELARRKKRPEEPAAAADERVREIQDGWSKVLADPDNPDKLWLGHPYRRWSSFLKTSTLDGLLASHAAIFAAHGVLDQAVPVSSFDFLCAELKARGRKLHAERLAGRDHGFRKPDDRPDSVDEFRAVLARVCDWFVTESEPIRAATQEEVQKLQGDWQVLAMLGDGQEVPLKGAMENLRITVAGEERRLHSKSRPLTRSLFRITPSVNPKQIDTLVIEGAQRGQILRGIYDLNGDTQRMCLARPREERPIEIASRPGDGHTLMILKRLPKTAAGGR